MARYRVAFIKGCLKSCPQNSPSNTPVGQNPIHGCSRGHISPDVPLEVLEAVLHAMRSEGDLGWGLGHGEKDIALGMGFCLKKHTGSGESFKGGLPEGNFVVPM